MKKEQVGAKEEEGADSASRLIDARIEELGDWRGERLAQVRTLIQQADPDVVEEWKWRGVPVWSHAKGASLDDPSGLFNASLEGNTRRAIDLHEGDTLDENALKALILAAVALNTSRRAKP